MVKRGGKKAQFQLSFGMLFSVILIISFIVVAIIVIQAVLRMQDDINVGYFIRDLTNRVDEIYMNPGGEENYLFIRNLGGLNIESVCFIDVERVESGEFKEIHKEITRNRMEENNMYFYPLGNTEPISTKIKHLNVEELEQNPHCVELENDIVKINLSKKIGESLVRVS